MEREGREANLHVALYSDRRNPRLVFKREGKKLRLNGWQRIGVVASVLWAIGGAYWGNNIRLHEGDWVLENYSACLHAPHSDWAECEKKLDKDWPAAISGRGLYAAFVGLVPIPLGWLMVYGIVALARWIRTGFNQK